MNQDEDGNLEPGVALHFEPMMPKMSIHSPCATMPSGRTAMP